MTPREKGDGVMVIKDFIQQKGCEYTTSFLKQ